MLYSENTCRTCLCDTGTVHIFKNNKLILLKLIACLKFQINENDGLPQKVCLKCNEKLNVSFDFIKQCGDADKKLKESSQKPNIPVNIIPKEEVKNENLEIGYLDNLKTEPNDDDDYDVYEDLKQDDNYIDDDDDFVKKITKTLLNITVKKSGINVKSTSSVKAVKSSHIMCEVCGKEYHRIGYKMHMKTHNIDLPNKKNNTKKKKTNVITKKPTQRTCIHCHRIFVNDIKGYDIHIKTKACRTIYQCKICKKQMTGERRFEIHVASHDKELSPCEFCGKTFKGRDLKRHVLGVHVIDEGLSCNVCGYKMKNKNALTNHLNRVHSKKRKFQCDHCNYFTYSKILMVNHMSIHLQIKRFACRFCNKRFRLQKSMIEHERLHTGERPYKCAVCLKGFAQKNNMKSHFRHNHKDIDYFELPKESKALSTSNVPTNFYPENDSHGSI